VKLESVSNSSPSLRTKVSLMRCLTFQPSQESTVSSTMLPLTSTMPLLGRATESFIS
jgi:hypothetical protein